MKPKYYDPDERARIKVLSRAADERALSLGQVSREELQYANGGQGMFRNAVLVQKSKAQKARSEKLCFER